MAIDPQWSGDPTYPTFYMKAGDTAPELVVQLMYADGTVKDLTDTDYVVMLYIKRAVGGRLVLSGQMGLFSPERAEGWARYQWDAPLEEGEYLMEVRVSLGDFHETFPRNGYMKLVVNAAL